MAMEEFNVRIDNYGNLLEIGDYVVIRGYGWTGILRGRVVRFTKKFVEVEVESPREALNHVCNWKWWIRPRNVIKMV